MPEKREDKEKTKAIEDKKDSDKDSRKDDKEKIKSTEDKKDSDKEKDSKKNDKEDIKPKRTGLKAVRDFIKIDKDVILVAILLLVVLFLFCFFSSFFGIFEKKVCGDGTPYGKCSETAPYFCTKGNLVQDAPFCGCPIGSIPKGDFCEYEYQTSPKIISLDYFFEGKSKKIDFAVYKGMENYLSQHPQSSFYSLGDNYSIQDFRMRVIDEPEQKKLLLPLVVEIQNLAKNKEDQARIAVSLVQNIPYESDANFDKSNYSLWSLKYPYDVLYQKEGLCGSKSYLLAFLLKEIGYDVVLFYYPKENHEAVGIRCPERYSLNKTGYCFVEATQPAIISYSEGEYAIQGKLYSTPEIIKISNGTSLGWGLKEYRDANIFYKIYDASEKNNGAFNLVEYLQYSRLVKRYGLVNSI